MSAPQDRLRAAASHVRRCGLEPFWVVALTHVPFTLLLLSVLSTFLKGKIALILAPIGIVIFLALCLFAALPMCVALSGYFIALVKGRHPRFLSIFCIFSDQLQYRQAFSAMLSAVLHALVYIALCALPMALAPLLPAALFPVLCVVSGLAMTLMLLNRLLAYAFVGHFSWEYPYLTPREALRLSARITQKRRLDLLRRLAPLVVLLVLTAPTLGLLSLAVLPFFYTLLADCYIEYKQSGAVSLPSPKEYAHV